jgi:hypothetical protein
MATNTSPKFDIHLDKPINERYAELTNYYKNELLNIIINCDTIYSKLVGFTVDKLISILTYYYKNNIMYIDEINYFSEVLHIPFHKVLLMQLMYEINAACTSICLKMNGKNILFRTMDWDLEFLKNITYQANYYKNNKKIFTATNWYGCIGLFTAANDNYAISINFRLEDNNNILKNIYRCLSLCMPISYAVRYVFENEYDLKNASIYLKDIHLIASSYITIMPTKKSPIVITRGPYDSITRSGKYCGYTLQTNVDDDKNEPNIIYSLQRRDKCNEILKNKQNMGSIDEITDAFFTFPIINQETIYTSIICIEDNLFNTQINA